MLSYWLPPSQRAHLRCESQPGASAHPLAPRRLLAFGQGDGRIHASGLLTPVVWGVL
jgi:hypothetical protein